MKHLRMNKHSELSALIWFFSMTLGLAQSQALQTEGSEALTIEQAVAEAVEKNLDLIAERYNLPIADARIVTAKLRPNPVLSLWGNYLDILGTGFNSATNAAGPSESGARVDFVLERGGKRQERIALAEDSKAVSQLQLLNSTRTLILEASAGMSPCHRQPPGPCRRRESHPSVSARRDRGSKWIHNHRAPRKQTIDDGPNEHSWSRSSRFCRVSPDQVRQ